MQRNYISVNLWKTTKTVWWENELTLEELNKVLRRSGKDTAPGPDRIQYWDIKNLTEEDWAELYTIYQESFDKGYIPKDWTDSFLRPVPKPQKDHHKLTGYRILTVCASAVNTLAVSALLAQLTDLWFSAINRSDLSKDVFLDLKTHTFDLVAHKILLSKLSVYFCLFIQSELTVFICSYLNNRVQRVFIRGSYSSEGIVKYGVPKGSVLGPVLTLLHLD